MEDLDEIVRIRSRITKRSRLKKNELGVSWQRVVELGLEQIEKINNHIKDLEMIGAYTPAWISAIGVLRLSPTARANVARMTPILIYYVIEIGRCKANNVDKRNFKLFYKERKADKMKTRIFSMRKVRSCIVEEFRLDNEEAAKW